MTAGCVEPVLEDIAKDQMMVVRTKQIDEETLKPMTFEDGIASVGTAVLF